MKPKNFKISKKRIFPELVLNLVYDLNVRLFRVFGIDQDII